MRVRAAVCTLLLLGGCSMETHTRAETVAEVRAVLDGAVAATDLPVTRSRTEDADALLLSCDDGTERLSLKVLADDPPELEPLAEALVTHFRGEGWALADELRSDGEGGPGVTWFLLRDGFEAVVDVVRGTEGAGVDLLVRSPCRALD